MFIFKHTRTVMFVTKFHANQEGWSPFDTCYYSTYNFISCWVVHYAQDLRNYPPIYRIDYYVYGKKYHIKKHIFICTKCIIIQVASLHIKVTYILMYAILSFVSLCFICVLLPETHSYNLEEIEGLYTISFQDRFWRYLGLLWCAFRIFFFKLSYFSSLLLFFFDNYDMINNKIH